jgi:hypothetical protein
MWVAGMLLAGKMEPSFSPVLPEFRHTTFLCRNISGAPEFEENLEAFRLI